MAREDKLWFELGVRDEVSKYLDRMISKTEMLERSLLAVGKKSGYKEAIQNTRDYEVALDKINYALKRIGDAKLTVTDSKSLSELEEVEKKLRSMRGEFTALWEDIKKQPHAIRGGLNEKGLISTFAQERGLDLAMTQVNRVLGENKERLRDKEKAEREATKAAREHEQELRNLARANQGLMESYDKVTKSGRHTMDTLSMLRQQAGYYFSLFGAQTLLKNVFTIGGQFEFQHVALQNILGDLQKANTLSSQLQGMAIESPKTFMELASSAKQLAAYQIPANELYDTTKRLSDLSVGLGVDVNRLILAFGQVRSAAVLRGQELRQFTEAGIPIVQALADKFTQLNGRITTTADVFKLISSRSVSFEMVRDVLWEMTNEGGRFYNMQATMADTLYGKWQKLQDIWQITLGDIANANNLSGKFFKVAIDGVIFLARNVQSLVPLISAFAAGRGIRGVARMFGEMTGSMKTIDDNIAKAQKLRSIELQRERITGKITEEAYQQGMAANANKARYYELLAIEGKISDRKLAQLAIEGKIEKAIANRILLEKGYTQAQIDSAMATNGKGLAGSLSRFGSNFLGFMGGWTGVALTAIGGVVAAISSYNQHLKEIEERERAMIDTAKERAKTLMNSYDAVKDKTPTNEKELYNQIDALEELLRSQDLYTEAIDKSVKSATSLTEKYEILKQSVKDAADAQLLMTNYSEMAKEAIDESGLTFTETLIGFGKGDVGSGKEVEENISNYEEAYAKLSSLVTSLGDKREILENEISKIGGSLGTSLKGKELEEQIRILVDSDAWDGIVNRINETDKYLSEYLEKIGKRAKKANSLWSQVADDDIPRIVQTIKRWIPAEGEENIRKWAQSNEKIVQAMINSIANIISFGAPKIREAFVNALRGSLGLSDIAGGNVKDDGAKQAYLSKVLLGKIVRQYGNGISSVNEMKGWTGDSKSEKTIQEAYEGIKKSRDEARERYNAAKAALKDYSNEKAAYERLEKVYKGSGAEEFFSLQSADKKNKTVRSSKTDEYAKTMKEHVSVLKDAYSEYKKFATQIGKDKAAAKIMEGGLFSSLFADENFKGIDNYRGELERIRASLNPAKTEQRKLIEAIDKMLLGMDYDDLKERTDKYIGLLRSAMSEVSKQWDNYKSLYEKTGDKKFAQLAFSGGMLWDDKTRAMADTLDNESGLGVISYDMSEDEAKEFFNYNTEQGKALYDQWKAIIDLVRGNYVSSLNDIAVANEKLMTNEEKIKSIEAKINDLKRNERVGEEDPRIKLMREDINRLKGELFELLPVYEQIFGDHDFKGYKDLKAAENAAKELIDNAKVGAKDKNGRASYFTSFYMDGNEKKEVTLTRQQLERLKKTIGDFFKKEKDVNPFKTLSDHIKDIYKILTDGNKETKVSSDEWKKLSAVLSDVSKIVGDFAGQMSGMFEALGNEGMAGAMDDVQAGMQSVQNIAQGFANGGPIGGIIAAASEAVGWVTRIAQAHDRKLDKSIQESTRRVKELENAYKNLESAIQRSLGGIYTSGGYEDMLKNYKSQLAELEKQREDESRKKKEDKDKLVDYEQQIKEMRDTIKYFAEDMAKSLYDIDVKSWAQELTSSIVDAWSKGEDAAEAFHNKVKDIVKDLTTNILTQKIMEAALQPVLNTIVSEITDKEGKLDEGSIERFARELDERGGAAVESIVSILDRLKQRGWDLSEQSESSSTASAGIKSITENTADLLASYINAIRADVSVNRITLTQILFAVQTQTEMPVIARAQLAQLEQIAGNTQRNADSAAMIYELLKGNTNNVNQFHFA